MPTKDERESLKQTKRTRNNNKDQTAQRLTWANEPNWHGQMTINMAKRSSSHKDYKTEQT